MSRYSLLQCIANTLERYILLLKAAIDFDEVAQGLNKRVIIQQAVFQVSYSCINFNFILADLS